MPGKDRPTAVQGPDDEVDLRATVVEYDDRPDECTIHPPTVSDDHRTTAWITAEAGSFVDVRRWR